MSYAQPTSPQRFEYKYLVSEARAQWARAVASAHLIPDPHADTAHGNAYPVYSLYLDSPGLALYHKSRSGTKNRFKLRVRYYDGLQSTPAFLEVKARRNDVIRKLRAPVWKAAVGDVLSSFCMGLEQLCEASAAGLGALGQFCELGLALGARPTAVVRYEREAYVEPGGGPLRLTLDREIACLHTDHAGLETGGAGWLALRNRWVVLEVKFTDTFPLWAGEMVRALELTRTSVAKYVQSVSALMRAGVGVA